MSVRERSRPAASAATRSNIERSLVVDPVRASLFQEPTLMTRASLVLAALLYAAPTFAQPTVAGDWNLTIQSPTGPRSIPLTLKQDGEKVTGSIKAPQGELPVEGTLVGSDLKFSFAIPIQGNTLDI